MSTSAISSSTSSTQASSTTSNAFADMSSEEFINILVTELTQQDPFKPNDSTAILEQLSSLRNIESQSALQTQLQTMVDQNAISNASGLIGQYVTGINSDNDSVEGIVQSIAIENGEPILKFADGSRLEASRITDVANLGDYDTQVVQQLLRNLIILNSSALVGKTVSGYNDAGTFISGIVTSVVPEDDDLILELDSGQSLSAGSVTQFTDTKTDTTTE